MIIILKILCFIAFLIVYGLFIVNFFGAEDEEIGIEEIRKRRVEDGAAIISEIDFTSEFDAHEEQISE